MVCMLSLQCFCHLLIVMLFYSAIFNEKLNLFFKKGDDEC